VLPIVESITMVKVQIVDNVTLCVKNVPDLTLTNV